MNWISKKDSLHHKNGVKENLVLSSSLLLYSQIKIYIWENDAMNNTHAIDETPTWSMNERQ